MRICLVFYDMQEFGGLEEYAATLAIGLQQQGHQVNVFSTAWVPPDNQYLRRLREHNVALVQLPKWLSYPASHWPTKEQILASVMWLLSPLTMLLGSLVFVVKRRSWERSQTSARHWLQGQLMHRLIGPDHRRPLTRLLLNWWRYRWRPDVLHLQGYTTNLLFVIDWAHRKGLPVVYEEHQTPDTQFNWWQGFQQSINKAAVVVAVSEKSAQALVEVCGVTRPIVVRSPLLPDPAATGWRQDKRLRRSNGPVRITTVARLYVTKGLTYLLEAIVQVQARYPTAEFRVYGEGELRQELLQYAAQLGLDGNTIFAGAFTTRTELSEIMSQTDIFVLPSILEGKPLAVVEAMAYGCPIVATCVGGVPELIQDGVNGLLCIPADPVCLAAKIGTLISQSELRLTLGRAARTTYEQSPFQPAALCTHFELIYQQALSEASAI